MAIAKKSYILTLDGKAVEQDGKQTGVILVGAGGTIDDDTAKKYGVKVEKSNDTPDNVAPVQTLGLSGAVADAPAVEAAQRTVDAINDGKGGGS